MGSPTNQPTESFNPFDPAGVYKEMRDTGLDAWAKMMVQFVNTEAYAEGTGSFLDAWLANSGPFRKVLEDTMALTLSNLNLPTRDDVTRLAERMTNIEMRLDDLDAKLDEAIRPQRPASANKRAKSKGEEHSQ